MNFLNRKEFCVLSLSALVAVGCKPRYVAKVSNHEAPIAHYPAKPHGGFEYPESAATGWTSKECTSGALQSPVRLSRKDLKVQKNGQQAIVTPIHIEARSAPALIQAVHGSVRVGYDKVSTAKNREQAPGALTLGDAQYFLEQFHFHTPAEHKIDNEQHAMEMHFVFMNEQVTVDKATGKNVSHKKAIALGFLFQIGDENPALNQLLPHLVVAKYAAHDDQIKLKEIPINPADFMPKELEGQFAGPFWSYEGSLTTPDCTEIVNHIVFSKPLTASAKQINDMKMGGIENTNRGLKPFDINDAARDFKNVHVNVERINPDGSSASRK